jgi:hypothetical protein
LGERRFFGGCQLGNAIWPVAARVTQPRAEDRGEKRRWHLVVLLVGVNHMGGDRSCRSVCQKRLLPLGDGCGAAATLMTDLCSEPKVNPGFQDRVRKPTGLGSRQQTGRDQPL